MPKKNKYRHIDKIQHSPELRDEYDLVWKAIHEEKGEQGLKLLEKIADKDSYRWSTTKARCLFSLKRYEEAIHSYQKIKRWNTNRTALLGLARCYQEQDNYELGINALKQIPNANNDTEILLNLARFHEAFDKREEAIVYFKKIPNWIRDKRALLGLGHCYEQMGNYQQAIAHFKSIPNLSQDNLSLLSLARCYQKNKDYALAIASFKQIPNWKQDKDALLGIAHCNRIMGNKEESTDTFYEIPNWGENTQAAIGIARNLEESGNYNKAIDTLLKVPATKRTTALYLNLSRCYEELGNYHEALATYEQIPNFEYDKEALLGRAICFEKMGAFKKALDCFKLLLKLKKDFNTYLGLARCYGQMGLYAKALTVYDELRTWKYNIHTLLSLARCYETMGYFDDALMVYKKIRNWKQDKLALLGLARCNEKMGRFDDALDYFQLIKNYEEDKDIILSLARCYQDMGNFDMALKTIDTVPESQRDKSILLFYFRCFEETLNHSDSLAALELIPNWENDRQVLLSLAVYYANRRDFSKAFETFHKIPYLQTDKVALISLARAYETMQDYDSAFDTYHQIPNWEHDKKTLLSLGRTYEKMGKYTETLETYHKIPKWENDKQALLSIAICNNLMSNPQANQLYESLLKKFPYYSEGHISNCRRLVEENNEEALNTIEATLKKLPYIQPLYLLKARIYENNNDTKKLFETLLEAKQQFPYNPDSYLSLIRYHLINGERQAAQEIIDDCYKRFPGFEKLFLRIDKILNMAQPLLMFSYVEDLTAQHLKRVSLPDHLRELFSFLEQIPGEHILCGSTVMRLIMQQTQDKGIEPLDTDIVSSCTSNSALRKKGFKKSRHMAQLYTIKVGDQLIDFYKASNASNWKDRDIRNRDFTICSLYCDKEGNIHDPTGMGISDLMNKLLRMNGNPRIRLKDDPTRLLRAAKYITLGFQPVANLAAALHEWQPTNNLDRAHLYAVARKHLFGTDRREYVRVLQSYGLLEKLFGIEPRDNIEEALWELETILEIDHVFYEISEHQEASIIEENTDGQEADLPSLRTALRSNPRLAYFVVEKSEEAPKPSIIDSLDLASANPNLPRVGLEENPIRNSLEQPIMEATTVSPILDADLMEKTPNKDDLKSNILSSNTIDSNPGQSPPTKQKPRPRHSKHHFFSATPANLEASTESNPANLNPSPSQQSSKRRRARKRELFQAVGETDDLYHPGLVGTAPKCTLF